MPPFYTVKPRRLFKTVSLSDQVQIQRARFCPSNRILIKMVWILIIALGITFNYLGYANAFCSSCTAAAIVFVIIVAAAVAIAVAAAVVAVAARGVRDGRGWPCCSVSPRGGGRGLASTS